MSAAHDVLRGIASALTALEEVAVVLVELADLVDAPADVRHRARVAAALMEQARLDADVR